MLSDTGYSSETTQGHLEADSSSQALSWGAGNLDAALASASGRALRYERQIRDFEAKLSPDLSNFRAVEHLLQAAFTDLNQTQRSADTALSNTAPQITHALEEDLYTLQDLEHRLPQTLDHVRQIKHVYDHGRDKARDLMNALEWINTPLSLRLRTIIFTPNAPVSPRWKVLVRTAFAIVFLFCIWIAWITLQGALRAHRHRLVWGERLMS